MNDKTMNENTGQWLSAALDDELGDLSEFEIHQLLKACEEPDTLDTFERYALASSVLSGDVVNPGSSLLVGVRTGIEAEPDMAMTGSTGGERPQWLRPLGRVAVAASVAVAVVFGANMLDTSTPDEVRPTSPVLAQQNGGGIDTTTSADNLNVVRRAVPENGVTYVSDGAAAGNYTAAANETSMTLSARQLQQVRQQRMRRYLMYHLEHASLNNNSGMLPFARVSNLETETATGH